MKNRVAARCLAAILSLPLTIAAACPGWSQDFYAGPSKIEWVAVLGNLAQSASAIAQSVIQYQASKDQALLAQYEAALLQEQALLTQAQNELQTGMASINALLATVSQSVAATGSTLASMGNVLAFSLSCPVFEGAGTLLGEDSCAWGKATGQRTTQYGTTLESAGFHIGGQKEMAPGWFLGGALGAGSTWTQAAGGFASLGQSFDGSIAVKHVRGPWQFAGALGLSTSATHTTRSPGTGTIAQADSNVFQGGVRLRGAYEFAFADWYARPRLDVDAYYTSLGGFQEYGTAPTAMVVAGRSRASVAIAPTLELGGRIALGAETILRPYVAGGAVILPDNVWTLDVSFTGAAARFGTFRNVFQGPNVLGTVEAGLHLYQSKGQELKVEYRLAAGESFVSQSVGLRGAWHF